MANENFIVTSLPAYVEQQRPVLVKDIVFGTPTVSRIVPQTGIKTTAKINYISADPVLQDGSNCGWSPQNTTELNQRAIETAIIKVNEEYCPDTLLGKWAEWNVRIPETQRENLPFEGYVLQILSNSIKNKIEKLVWQGNKLSLDADLRNAYDCLQDLYRYMRVTQTFAEAVENIRFVALKLPEKLIPAM